jgi:hypothetical protein
MIPPIRIRISHSEETYATLLLWEVVRAVGGGLVISRFRLSTATLGTQHENAKIEGHVCVERGKTLNRKPWRQVMAPCGAESRHTIFAQKVERYCSVGDTK